MDRVFVESLSIKNYGCIRDATLRLTPLHALIGPNDSGKTTILNALGTLSVYFGDAAGTWDGQKLERLLLASRSQSAAVLDAT